MSSVQSNTAPVEAMRGGTLSAAAVTGEGLWFSVWKQFRRNPIALAGLYVVCILVAMALFADFLANDQPYYSSYRGKIYFPIFRSYLVGAGLAHWPAELQNVNFKKLEGATQIFPPIPYRQTNIDLFAPFESPSKAHWLGTDRLGRDVMAGMIHGSRISLSIGFVAVGLAVVIGVILGALAGYFGSWVDLVISRIFEIELSIPTFFLLIAFASEYLPDDDHHRRDELGGHRTVYPQRIFKDPKPRLCDSRDCSGRFESQNNVQAYPA